MEGQRKEIKYPHFGANLRWLRLSRKITQERLSAELGVKRTAYTMWEGGISRPNPVDEKKIANFYHISVDALHNESVEEMPIAGLDTKKPGTEPGINEKLAEEVIEASKAQRETNKALLENQEHISRMVQAALESSSNLSTNLNTIFRVVEGNEQKLDALREVVVYRVAEALKIKPSVLENQLRAVEGRIAQDLQSKDKYQSSDT